MIPVSLKLSNFTSYGENIPELDFTKFHLAVISGTNGVGKSSLLDAITWCVWGWSRAGDGSDQLVRLGVKEMWVEFSFELDNHLYTVKRRRSLKGGGSTALELWSNSHNLTEGTIKATQQKIINLLHLTIETFTNSSFLRQGHADEFTTKGPTERKKILADILGLDHYDLLEEKAKEKVKESSTKLQLLDYQLLEVEAELSQKEEREKNLSQIQEDVKKVEQELKEAEGLIKEVENKRQLLSSKIELLNDKQRKIIETEKEIVDLKLQVEMKQKTQQEFKIILEKKEEIEKNYQLLQQCQLQQKALEGKRTQLIKVRDELTQIQKVLIDRESKRSSEINKLEIEIRHFETTNNQLQTQNSSLSKKGALCPTCGQPLAKEKNHSIILQNKKLISENNLKITQLQEKIAKYKSFVLPESLSGQEKEEQIKKLEDETKDWDQLQEEINSLEKYSPLYLKLQQAQAALSSQEDAVKDLQKILTDKEKQIAAEKVSLQDLEIFEKQLLEIRQELSLKDTVKSELTQKHLELTGQVGEAKQLMSRVAQLEKYYVSKKEEKDQLTTDKEAYEELSLAFGKKGIQAMIIETAIPEIEEEANNLLDKLTEGRMKVSFETLREAKTKVGGEYGVIETLDIIISDEMGERSYEMYSGGEAFRVNFAIRLALSKLLTRRAGAKLQFLVIDEGFGTQDAAGRSRIVEVLDTIKNDFEKIVVITHLEELKEEFPVRIEVSKNSAGSTFELVGV